MYKAIEIICGDLERYKNFNVFFFKMSYIIKFMLFFFNLYGLISIIPFYMKSFYL